SPRSDLFSEDPAVAGRHRCVVEAAGIDGDLVPVAKPVDGARPGTPVLSEIAQVRSSSEAWPEDLTETAGESIGAGATGQDEREPAREPRRERRPCARVPLADQAERPQVEEPCVEPGRDE